MEIITLEKGLNVYHFSKEAKGEFVSYNILILEDGDNCFIVDTAFRRHFKKLQKDLLSKNKKITHAAITHFHRDHIGGIPRIKDAVIYGSKNAEVTLKKVFKTDDYTNYKPTQFVEKETIQFGNFRIDLVMNVGHSIDGLLVVINNRYVFVGDDMIYDIENQPLLPFASEGDYISHVKSLMKIMSYANNGVIIPAHGKIIKDKRFFREDITNRITYLKYMYANKGKTYNDFTKETGIKFNTIEWYKKNV